MPRTIRMPGPSVVPEGARRTFLEELYTYYKAAGRPTLTEISDAIADGEYRGTASRETVRRILTQGAVPTRWTTVEAIFMALCGIAKIDPSSDQWDESFNESPTRLAYFRNAWNEAVDEEESPPRGRHGEGFGGGGFGGGAQSSTPPEDPWAVSPVAGSGEPLF